MGGDVYYAVDHNRAEETWLYLRPEIHIEQHPAQIAIALAGQSGGRQGLFRFD